MTDLVREYTTALFELVSEEGVVDTVTQDVACVADALKKSPAYLDILAMPNIDIAEKKKIIKRTFSKAHPHLLHFLMLLTERGYAKEIPACLAAYDEFRLSAEGIRRAVVESAVSLTPEEKKALTDTLANRFRCKIELVEKIDASLIGGARVYVDGRLLDGTVRHRLDGIAARLTSTVL